MPGHDVIHYGSPERGYRDLCSACFNADVAKSMGLEGFENVRFDPITLTDCRGVPHEFHLRAHLFGNGVSLDAFELHEGHPAGYEFKVIGEPEEDQLALLGKLVEKMRRALAVKHLAPDELGGQKIADFAVRGRVSWDEENDGHLPLVVIDGQDVTWEQLGRMLMSFEGWQFKLEIRDLSEEV